MDKENINRQNKLENIFEYFDYIEGYQKDSILSGQVLSNKSTLEPFKNLFGKYLAYGRGGDGVQLWTIKVKQNGSTQFYGKEEYKKEAEEVLKKSIERTYDEKIINGIGEKFFNLSKQEKEADIKNISECFPLVKGSNNWNREIFNAILEDYRENGNELIYSKQLKNVIENVNSYDFKKDNKKIDEINKLINKMEPIDVDRTLNILQGYSENVYKHLTDELNQERTH